MKKHKKALKSYFTDIKLKLKLKNTNKNRALQVKTKIVT